MANADSRARAAGQPVVDLLVVGGGVMGLWTALYAGRAGLSVRLIERERIGAGASGGLLGALMPHLPDRWNAKKAFQFEALVSLEGEVAALEAETGLSAGYRRSGRLIPLARPHHREIALSHARDAETVWRSGERSFAFEVLDETPVEGWPAGEAMANGLVRDHLAARLSPRSLLAVLRAAIGRLANVTVEEGRALAALDPAGSARLDDGTVLSFGDCVLAAGVETFGLLAPLGPPPARPVGTAVKGQAALLRAIPAKVRSGFASGIAEKQIDRVFPLFSESRKRSKADVDPALPVIFSDGLYIVPHGNGLVAVGSTSENAFAEPFSTDGLLDDLIGRARRMVPVLRDAEVVERWAGLRPKAIGRDPMVGRHPNHPRLSLMTGGFKVSFGMAHALARAVLDEMRNGTPADVPSSFRAAAHLEEAGRT